MCVCVRCFVCVCVRAYLCVLACAHWRRCRLKAYSGTDLLNGRGGDGEENFPAKGTGQPVYGLRNGAIVWRDRKVRGGAQKVHGGVGVECRVKLRSGGGWSVGGDL